MYLKFGILVSSVLSLLLGGARGFMHLTNPPNKEVKGLQTTQTSSTTDSTTPIVTPSPSPLPLSLVVTSTERQFGGWYWNYNLGKAQRWMGKDVQGGDIWSDTGDTPMPTPTPTPPNSNQSKTTTITTNPVLIDHIGEMQVGASTKMSVYTEIQKH